MKLQRIILPLLLLVSLSSYSQVTYMLKAGTGIQNLIGSYEFYLRVAEIAGEVKFTEEIGVEADFNINVGFNAANSYLFGLEGKYYLEDNIYGGVRFAAGPAQFSGRFIEVGATGGYVIEDILEGLELYGFLGYSNYGFSTTLPFVGKQTFTTGFFNLSVGANVHLFGNN